MNKTNKCNCIILKYTKQKRKIKKNTENYKEEKLKTATYLVKYYVIFKNYF